MTNFVAVYQFYKVVLQIAKQASPTPPIQVNQHPHPTKMKKYLGYLPTDYQLPYSKYYRESVVAPPGFVLEGLSKSPYPAGTITALTDVAQLANPDYLPIETGYSLETDGSICVAVLTNMPRVLPEMWEWWFGWHGCRADRYKLWHPKAHLDARWKDGLDDENYLNRTSHIEEYIGGSLEKAAIQFVAPATLGIQPVASAVVNPSVFICARVGFSQIPLDIGYLVHQIRTVEGGSEMRSRFWIGGQHIRLRGDNLFFNSISKAIQRFKKISAHQAESLLTHCSEEMNHLAAFLPELYQEFNRH